MFLATVVMLFAAFTSAYIVRRSASDWTPIELPWILWVNTVVLVASSIALERGRLAARQSRTVSARYGVSAAAGLGLLFLVGQVSAWRELAAQGVYVPTSPHSSFVYILTGAHGFHVAAGLVLLIYTATRMWSDRAGTTRLLTAAATFWHFLVALWFYVFVLVTVF
jgi:cytochrome c oxidase subunit 3